MDLEFIYGNITIYSRPDGSKFEGYWKYGKKDGNGKITSSKGETLEGIWDNDDYIDE